MKHSMGIGILLVEDVFGEGVPMARKICLRLKPEERKEVEGLYRRAREGSVKVRCLIIRLLDREETTTEIADKLGLSRITIWRWEQRYKLEGLSGLYTRPRKGRTPKLCPSDKELLVETVEKDPRSVGINASNWTTGLLAHYLERERGVKVSNEVVRSFLHRAGFKLKRPSPVVISPDPDYQVKRGNWRRSSSVT